MGFSDQLSFVLEDSSDRFHNSLYGANEIVREIDKLYGLISQLQNKLKILKKKINSELAIKIRNKNPGLNISVTPKKCKIGYKSKVLTFYPDIERGVWVISSTDEKFKNRFYKNNRRLTIMSDDLDPLASAISTFFIEYYKSLNEGIHGNGLVMIDEQKVSFMQLASYGNLE